MAEMLERVADAIDAARYAHPEHPRERPRPFSEADQGDREYATRLARAAIATMRAPTDEMCQGAKPYMDSWSSNVAWWIAMHDMALHGAAHGQVIRNGVEESRAALREVVATLSSGQHPTDSHGRT